MSAAYLISSDLDGTLIDHHSYSYEAALPAVRRCQSLGIAIILNTSKTFDEVVALQKALKIEAPLIVENGSALFLSHTNNAVPHKEVFGVPRAEVLDFIKHVRKHHAWQFEGFNDWTLAEIANQTGLSLDEASKANSKQFSEPFIWRDTEAALLKFTGLAMQRGLKILRGGRFYHLQGDTDKAKPLAWLQQNYSVVFPELKTQPTLIALGDNHNDIAMLNAADIAVCLRSPVADYPSLAGHNRIIKTTGMGPEGWNQAINSILDG